jgi:hypothetical protein
MKRWWAWSLALLALVAGGGAGFLLLNQESHLALPSEATPLQSGKSQVSAGVNEEKLSSANESVENSSSAAQLRQSHGLNPTGKTTVTNRRPALKIPQEGEQPHSFRLPSLEALRADVDADPHGTPISLAAFSQSIVHLEKKALSDTPEAVDALALDLARCALFSSAGQVQQTPEVVRPFCYLRLQRLQAKAQDPGSFDSLLKHVYQRLEADGVAPSFSSRPATQNGETSP